MARSKRVFREWQHARDTKGRFAKRGSAAWVQRAGTAFQAALPESGTATRAGDRPRISRAAKGAAMFQAHTDGGRPSAVRVPQAVKTAVPSPKNLADFNAQRLPIARKVAAPAVRNLAGFNAPDAPKKRTPRAAPGAAALIAARREEQAPHLGAMVAARMAPETAPVQGAETYAAMRRHTLLALARDAKINIRGKTNTQIANELAAHDEQVKASRAAKLNPGGVGARGTGTEPASLKPGDRIRFGSQDKSKGAVGEVVGWPEVTPDGHRVKVRTVDGDEGFAHFSGSDRPMLLDSFGPGMSARDAQHARIQAATRDRVLADKAETDRQLARMRQSEPDPKQVEMIRKAREKLNPSGVGTPTGSPSARIERHGALTAEQFRALSGSERSAIDADLNDMMSGRYGNDMRRQARQVQNRLHAQTAADRPRPEQYLAADRTNGTDPLVAQQIRTEPIVTPKRLQKLPKAARTDPPERATGVRAGAVGADGTVTTPDGKVIGRLADPANVNADGWALVNTDTEPAMRTAGDRAGAGFAVRVWFDKSTQRPPVDTPRVDSNNGGMSSTTPRKQINSVAKLGAIADANAQDRRAKSLATRDGAPPTDGRPDITAVATSDKSYLGRSWNLDTSRGRDRTMSPDIARAHGGYMNDRTVSAEVMNPKGGTGDYRYRIYDADGNTVEEGSSPDAAEAFRRANRIFSSQRGEGMARSSGTGRVRFESRMTKRPKDSSRGDMGTGPFYDHTVVQINPDGSEREVSSHSSPNQAHSAALDRNEKERAANPGEKDAPTPTRRLQTFADRMRGEFSDAERLEMSLKNEEERQKLRARETERARQVEEARANDTRPEREKLAEQLQQDRAARDIGMRSGRIDPQREARIKKIEARLEELDTADRKAKIKDIRKGDKVKTSLGEFEVTGKTADGYLRVQRPDGRRGSVNPKHIEEVTKAPKADATPVAAGIDDLVKAVPDNRVAGTGKDRSGMMDQSRNPRILAEQWAAAVKTGDKVKATNAFVELAHGIRLHGTGSRDDRQALIERLSAEHDRAMGSSAAPAKLSPSEVDDLREEYTDANIELNDLDDRPNSAQAVRLRARIAELKKIMDDNGVSPVAPRRFGRADGTTPAARPSPATPGAKFVPAPARTPAPSPQAPTPARPVVAQQDPAKAARMGAEFERQQEANRQENLARAAARNTPVDTPRVKSQNGGMTTAKRTPAQQKLHDEIARPDRRLYRMPGQAGQAQEWQLYQVINGREMNGRGVSPQGRALADRGDLELVETRPGGTEFWRVRTGAPGNGPTGTPDDTASTASKALPDPVSTEMKERLAHFTPGEREQLRAAAQELRTARGESPAGAWRAVIEGAEQDRLTGIGRYARATSTNPRPLMPVEQRMLDRAAATPDGAFSGPAQVKAILRARGLIESTGPANNNQDRLTAAGRAAATPAGTGPGNVAVGGTDADRRTARPRLEINGQPESDRAYEVRTAPSRDAALAILNGNSLAGLRNIARGEGVVPGGTKGDLVARLIRIMRDRHEDGAAIERMVNRDRQTQPPAVTVTPAGGGLGSMPMATQRIGGREPVVDTVARIRGMVASGERSPAQGADMMAQLVQRFSVDDRNPEANALSALLVTLTQQMRAGDRNGAPRPTMTGSQLLAQRRTQAAPKMSDRPRLRNTWAGAPAVGQARHHPDSEVSRLINDLGADAQLDVGGDSLANRLDRIATDAVQGNATMEETVQRIQAVAAQLPEGHPARRRIEATVSRELDGPDALAPTLPAGADPGLARLVRELHAVPAVRAQPGREMAQLLDIVNRTAGTNEATSRRIIAELRTLINRLHESALSRHQIDSAIRRAVEALDQRRLNR